VARDELTAKKALRLIEVTYEEYPPLLTIESAAIPVHDEYLPDNLLASMHYYFERHFNGYQKLQMFFKQPADVFCFIESSVHD
jgi:CO/xanthine dehydrogenase Mo-binding subunit